MVGLLDNAGEIKVGLESGKGCRQRLSGRSPGNATP